MSATTGKGSGKGQRSRTHAAVATEDGDRPKPTNKRAVLPSVAPGWETNEVMALYHEPGEWSTYNAAQDTWTVVSKMRETSLEHYYRSWFGVVGDVDADGLPTAIECILCLHRLEKGKAKSFKPGNAMRDHMIKHHTVLAARNDRMWKGIHPITMKANDVDWWSDPNKIGKKKAVATQIDTKPAINNCEPAVAATVLAPPAPRVQITKLSDLVRSTTDDSAQSSPRSRISTRCSVSTAPTDDATSLPSHSLPSHSASSSASASSAVGETGGDEVRVIETSRGRSFSLVDVTAPAATGPLDGGYSAAVGANSALPVLAGVYSSSSFGGPGAVFAPPPPPAFHPAATFPPAPGTHYPASSQQQQQQQQQQHHLPPPPPQHAHVAGTALPLTSLAGVGLPQLLAAWSAANSNTHAAPAATPSPPPPPSQHLHPWAPTAPHALHTEAASAFPSMRFPVAAAAAAAAPAQLQQAPPSFYNPAPLLLQQQQQQHYYAPPPPPPPAVAAPWNSGVTSASAGATTLPYVLPPSFLQQQQQWR